MLNLFLGNIRDARELLEIFWGGPELLEKLEKGISVKNMDFGVLLGGAEGAKTFWGLSGVYKVTTQKKKN